ncbi:MAG: hypothetical protein KDD56_01810 [Bdellovibrionales bacterium]|nr:hypothetical protein [Bdellovibrionales bacterium]
MCGIFGVVANGKNRPDANFIKSAAVKLLRLSQTRGSEAAGMAALLNSKIKVFKAAVSPKEFLKSPILDQIFLEAFSEDKQQPIVLIGHSRMVTNGSQENHFNNQPVITSNMVGIHNGIVVNDKMLWEKYPDLKRKYDVDSEVLFALLRKFYSDVKSVPEAIKNTYSEIEGQASIAGLFSDLNCLMLASNNGSLYYLEVPLNGILLFASEFGILNKLKEDTYFSSLLAASPIIQIKAGDAALVNFETAKAQHFNFNDFDFSKIISPTNGSVRLIEDVFPKSDLKKTSNFQGLDVSTEEVKIAWGKYPYDTSFADSLIRCTKCVLPETMPYISFDKDGVCSYCRNYKNISLYGKDSLKEIAASIRSSDGSPDCLVGLSGGRDSCYGLHYLIKELGLNPVAYTFDWGMVTDLARRNISRMCGKLGVEHILVSAHIPTKRKFISQNVNAWLKRPRLGMIPLFMAGDKAYFYHAERLKKELKLPVIFLCENMLERTDFKSGFAGLAPKAIDEDRVYTLSLINKLKIFWYYGKEYLLNPSYINTSLIDTLSAFSHYYMMDKEYYNLFKFIPWIEDEVISTLCNEYDWELANDTVSTWRIGDGTASFYNYIYYKVAGFTENDTFRSNQIREGLITRDEALQRIAIENKPRLESMHWYCQTNGIDFRYALERINQIPKLPRLSVLDLK